MFKQPERQMLNDRRPRIERRMDELAHHCFPEGEEPRWSDVWGWSKTAKSRARNGDPGSAFRKVAQAAFYMRSMGRRRTEWDEVWFTLKWLGEVLWGSDSTDPIGELMRTMEHEQMVDGHEDYFQIAVAMGDNEKLDAYEGALRSLIAIHWDQLRLVVQAREIGRNGGSG